MPSFAQSDTFLLAAGVLGVLLLASVTGFALKRAVAGGRPHAAIDNLNSRVRSWWLMVAAIGLALLAGKTGVIALFAFASFTALREYTSIAPTRRGDHLALLLSFFLAVPFQYLLIWMEWYGFYTIFIPVYCFLVLPTLSAVRGEVRDFMQRAAVLQWGLMICVYCLSHVPALLSLDIPGYQGRNAFLLVFLILVVQSSDVLQYVWGKLLGKTKIAPEVSPGKTVAGLVGGLACTAVLGAALWWITPFTPAQAGLIAFGLALMGFLGGLVMSAIKRDRGVKDWGTMIEGHGGVLDRLDSVCFSAPIFFHIVRYWWTP
ncbi:MAG TPA: phosphatidate cytidylyltransferase [Burkholderiales bacterium]|nr:phosphatidate cytidylyltransferase [Burkholderiales bacterium]